MPAASPQPLLILGTRTLAEDVADLVGDIPAFELAGFVENMNRERCSETIDGLPVIWFEELPGYAATHHAVCALATTQRSRFTDQAEAAGMQFATVVHGTSRVSSRSAVGEGSIVSAGVVVATRTQIGRHVFVNRGVLIGHHTTIGDYVSIMPGANIAGNSRIGDGVYIGMGAIVIDNVTVGEHSVIGAGSVVTKEVPPFVEVVGIPARIVKQGIAGK